MIMKAVEELDLEAPRPVCPKVTGAGPTPPHRAPREASRRPEISRCVAVGEPIPRRYDRRREQPLSRVLESAVEQPVLLRKGVSEAELSQGAKRLRTDPKHRSSEEIQSEPLRRNAHSRAKLKHHRPVARPSEVLGVKFARHTKSPGADHTDQRVAFEPFDDRVCKAGRGQKVEQAACAATLRPYRICAPHRSTSSREPCRHIDSGRAGPVPAATRNGRTSRPRFSIVSMSA